RRNRPRYPGFVITLFGAWYGCQRILEDFLREDRHLLPGLTGSQITAIITVLVCLWHLLFVRRTPRWGNWDRPAVEPTGEATGEAMGEPDEAAQQPLPTSVIGEPPETEE